MARITTRVNHVERTFEDTGGPAVHAIRNELGLTGTKLVCGTGSCGACIVQVDGVPVASCLLPAAHMADRTVTTIEGIAGEASRTDVLHPVQRAFVAHDALQCGFCTPGFVVESVAFFDRWRTEHGPSRPPHDEIAKALAGHLCRCGAYRGIYSAVESACAGEFDDHSPQPVRVDAEQKVRGAATYTVDVHLPGMLFGVVVRSTEAHAEVTEVDLSPARALPGVRAAIELLEDDHRVRYVGQEIAAVAAVDMPTARRAAAAVRVVYRPLGTIVGIAAATRSGAPELAGKGWKPANSAESGTLMPARLRGNVRGPTTLGSAGRVRARRALTRAEQHDDERLLQMELHLPSVSHTSLEPHTAVAEWESPDRLRVFASTQMVRGMARLIAKRYGLEERNVTVIADAVGGGFGSKQGLQTEAIVAIEMAQAAGAPVRVVFDRREELEVGGYRPGGILQTKIAGKTSGEITGMTMEARLDGGASAGQMVTTALRFVYRGIPRYLADYDVLTNAPPGKPFRAPGLPLAIAALESAIDRYAAEMDVDPITIRRRWKPGATRSRVYDWVESNELWKTRGDTGSGRYRRGVGVAFGAWAAFFESNTRVVVRSGPDGLSAATATQDLGNGVRTLLARAVAEVFGVEPGSIEVAIGNSTLPVGPVSGGSRGTASVWPTAAATAVELRRRLVEKAVTELSMTGASPIPGGLDHRGEEIPWSDLLPRLGSEQVELERPKDKRRRLLPVAIDGLSIIRGLSHSAHIVELEVDTRLARARATRVDGVLAAGVIHVPELARSQAYGSIVQGVGYGLYEERLLDPASGVNVTSSLDSFRIMGIADLPQMSIDFIEGGFEDIGGGGVGLAELAFTSVPAAVINAYGKATGQWPDRLPLRPDRVLEVLR